MTTLNRRSFLQLAAAFGATAAWGTSLSAASAIPWRERRDLYPEGVASADPHSDSILLWTRHAPLDSPAKLTVELAEDSAFQKAIASAHAPVSGASDCPGGASFSIIWLNSEYGKAAPGCGVGEVRGAGENEGAGRDSIRRSQS